MFEAGLLFVGGMPGGMELGIILLLVMLLFGADKLPKLARSTGQAMGEFRKGREEIEQELRESAGDDEDRRTGTTNESGRSDSDLDTETERAAGS